MSFVRDIKTLIAKGKILNHLNFSGMSISPPVLLDLCTVITASPLILGVHLNDLGIIRDQKLHHAALQIFGLVNEDLPKRR